MNKLSKSLIATASAALLSIGCLAGCSSDDAGSGPAKDGKSVSQEDKGPKLKAGEEVDPHKFFEDIRAKSDTLDTVRVVGNVESEIEGKPMGVSMDLVVDQRDRDNVKAEGTMGTPLGDVEVRLIGKQAWMKLDAEDDQWIDMGDESLVDPKDVDPTQSLANVDKVVYDGEDDVDGVKADRYIVTDDDHEMTVWVNKEGFLIRIYFEEEGDSEKGVTGSVTSTIDLKDFNTKVDIQAPENVLKR